MSNETDNLRKAHQQAQEARRALETEQRELPGQIDFAMSGADVVGLQRLSQRKRDLPGEIQLASQIEHATYSAYVNAQQQSERELCEEWQQKVDEADAALLAHRQEASVKDIELQQALNRAIVKRNTHERECEAWASRFSNADRRFRAVVAEQERSAA